MQSAWRCDPRSSKTAGCSQVVCSQVTDTGWWQDSHCMPKRAWGWLGLTLIWKSLWWQLKQVTSRPANSLRCSLTWQAWQSAMACTPTRGNPRAAWISKTSSRFSQVTGLWQLAQSRPNSPLCTSVWQSAQAVPTRANSREVWQLAQSIAPWAPTRGNPVSSWRKSLGSFSSCQEAVV